MSAKAKKLAKIESKTTTKRSTSVKSVTPEPVKPVKKAAVVKQETSVQKVTKPQTPIVKQDSRIVGVKSQAPEVPPTPVENKSTNLKQSKNNKEEPVPVIAPPTPAQQKTSQRGSTQSISAPAREVVVQTQQPTLVTKKAETSAKLKETLIKAKLGKTEPVVPVIKDEPRGRRNIAVSQKFDEFQTPTLVAQSQNTNSKVSRESTPELQQTTLKQGGRSVSKPVETIPTASEKEKKNEKKVQAQKKQPQVKSVKSTTQIVVEDTQTKQPQPQNKKISDTMSIINELKQKLNETKLVPLIKDPKKEKEAKAVAEQKTDIQQESPASGKKGRGRKQQLPEQQETIQAVSEEQAPQTAPTTVDAASKQKSKGNTKVVNQKEQVKEEVKQSDAAFDMDIEDQTALSQNSKLSKSTQVDSRIVTLEKPPSIVKEAKEIVPTKGTIQHTLFQLSDFLEQASDIVRSMEDHVDKVDKI